MGRKAIDPIERFNQKYIIDETTGCWLWQDKLKNGYGRLLINGKAVNAHRFSYEYFVGPLDSSLEICHQCFNKRCVNYNHLRQDTRKSNMIDMVIDGKQSFQKLSVEQVIEIKKRLVNYSRGMNGVIAKEYGVSSKTISQIKNGNRWAYISIP